MVDLSKFSFNPPKYVGPLVLKPDATDVPLEQLAPDPELSTDVAVPMSQADTSPEVFAAEHESNSFAPSGASNPGDILPDSATAEEVAQNTALFGQETQSVDKPMNIKTTGKENKKIVLGFGLNGYKSILDTSPSTSGIPNQYGIGLSDDEICWLVSVYHIYENDGRRVGSEWNSL